MPSISINIGIIGPVNIVEQLKQALKYFPNFKPIFKVSDDIFDAPKFTKELEDKVEVLFYSGYLPYSISKHIIPGHLPAHYIPLKGASLYRALYNLQKKTPHMKTVSIDSLTSDDFKRVLDELDESIEHVPFQMRATLDISENIIDFHKILFEMNKTNAVLTGMKVISDALTESNIPNVWVTPTQEDMIVALERALLSTQSRKNRESQIVIGSLHVRPINIPKNEAGQLLIRFQHQINSYIEQLDGHLTQINLNEFSFVTTRGVFERITEGYKFIPIFHGTKDQLEINIGVGFGFSAFEAGSHARIALMQSKNFEGSTCFIVREDKSVIGPLEMGPPLTYHLSVTDQKLLDKAKEIGASPSYLNKLMAIIQRKKLNEFTAHELAKILNITTRSTHRILLQWLDAELIEIVGTEKITTRGRPRQIYRLKELSLT
ncbi:hypothetical protein ACJROX_24455 [Pseudalkalibacillus sp. A8]|uniref:hypothetical protein n=1 Tax=Pseudalkalibacillus sp. A8 TaxID=3382641 RepID=UPI0038B57384